MNVCFFPYRDSRAISRIEAAFYAHSPSGIEWVPFQDADLIILAVIGRRDHRVAKARKILTSGRSYAVLQLALKSTRNPDPGDWQELWEYAKIVWSYYWLPGNFNFYHAPLGAESNIFYPVANFKRDYLVGATGDYTRTECLWELDKAAHNVGNYLLRIQADDDIELNRQYNHCRFISGLRRKEGFELPAAEGILAGARPVLFDTPDFRRWYDGIADFIPENNLLATVNNLTHLFNTDIAPVTDMEILCARYRFDWGRLIAGFWERCQ